MQIEYECKIMVTSIIQLHVCRSAGVAYRNQGLIQEKGRLALDLDFIKDYICLRPKCLNSRNMRGSKLIFCFPYISILRGVKSLLHAHLNPKSYSVLLLHKIANMFCWYHMFGLVLFMAPCL